MCGAPSPAARPTTASRPTVRARSASRAPLAQPGSDVPRPAPAVPDQVPRGRPQASVSGRGPTAQRIALTQPPRVAGLRLSDRTDCTDRTGLRQPEVGVEFRLDSPSPPCGAPCGASYAPDGHPRARTVHPGRHVDDARSVGPASRRRSPVRGASQACPPRPSAGRVDAERSGRSCWGTGSRLFASRAAGFAADAGRSGREGQGPV